MHADHLNTSVFILPPLSNRTCCTHCLRGFWYESVEPSGLCQAVCLFPRPLRPTLSLMISHFCGWCVIRSRRRNPFCNSDHVASPQPYTPAGAVHTIVPTLVYSTAVHLGSQRNCWFSHRVASSRNKFFKTRRPHPPVRSPSPLSDYLCYNRFQFIVSSRPSRDRLTLAHVKIILSSPVRLLRAWCSYLLTT